MKNLANAKSKSLPGPSIKLVDTLERTNSNDSSWLGDLLKSIFSPPDMNYEQFVELESKKTRRQIELKRWY